MWMKLLRQIFVYIMIQWKRIQLDEEENRESQGVEACVMRSLTSTVYFD